MRPISELEYRDLESRIYGPPCILVSQEKTGEGKDYFIADTHFNDSGIMAYANRNFESVKEMTVIMAKLWNETVTHNDRVFVLGDFATGDIDNIYSVLNGEKILIKGNHDTESNQYYREKGFAEVYDYPIIYKKFFILSHEPVFTNESMPYVNLFGHVHNNPIYADKSSKHFCVCAERIHYRPICFEHILKMIGE